MYISGKGRGAAGYNRKMQENATALKPSIRKLSKHLRKLEAKLENYDLNIDITDSEEERDIWDFSDNDDGDAIGLQQGGQGAAVNAGASGSGTVRTTAIKKSGESIDEIVRMAVASAMKAQTEQFAQRKQEWTFGDKGNKITQLN